MERLRGDLRAAKADALATLLGSSLGRRPGLLLASVAIAGAAAGPVLLRLLRSPGRALGLARAAAPFLRDVLRASDLPTADRTRTRHGSNGSARGTR